jgi:hypothetical protein
LAGEFQGVEIALEEFPEEPRASSARVVLSGDLKGA